jgi:predicted DNA-binding transcriptional regulator YafY
MNLSITTIKHGEGYLALCVHENGLWSAAGVGGAETEQSAAQQSVNAYFTHKYNAEQAHFVVPTTPRANTPAVSPLRGETPEAALALLKWSSDNNHPVNIRYIDGSGNETTREALVRYTTADHAVIFDTEKQVNRTFRLDRIQQVTVA